MPCSTPRELCNLERRKKDESWRLNAPQPTLQACNQTHSKCAEKAFRWYKTPWTKTTNKYATAVLAWPTSMHRHNHATLLAVLASWPLGRLRILTVLATRADGFTLCSPDLRSGVAATKFVLARGLSKSRSTASSPLPPSLPSLPSTPSTAVGGRVESVLTVHCSWRWTICTSREMSLMCEELHCMRALAWRCMRSTEAETRQYARRSGWPSSSVGKDPSSLGGVGGAGACPSPSSCA